MPEFLKEKLEVMGLKLEQVRPKNLVVPKGQKYAISLIDRKEPNVKWVKDIYTQVRPTSWAHLKQMVGVPNNAARRGTAVRLMPLNRLPSPAKLSDPAMSKADKAMYHNAIVKGYLYGDSAKYERWGPVLKKLLPDTIGIAILNEITVEAGSTLILDSSSPPVVADTITIKVGGLIECRNDADSGSPTPVFVFKADKIQGNVA